MPVVIYTVQATCHANWQVCVQFLFLSQNVSSYPQIFGKTKYIADNKLYISTVGIEIIYTMTSKGKN